MKMRQLSGQSGLFLTACPLSSVESHANVSGEDSDSDGTEIAAGS